MTPFEEIKAYFQEIASLHPSLKSFVHGDVRRFTAATRSELEYPCLWLETPNQKFEDNDTFTGVINSAAFIVLKNAETGDADAQDLIWSETNEIVWDIISKIRQDSGGRSQFINSKFFSIDPLDTLFVANDYGWRVEFTIKKKKALCYNPELWTPPSP